MTAGSSSWSGRLRDSVNWRSLPASDWHLGRPFLGRMLTETHAASANQLIDLVTAESVNVVKILFRGR